MSKIYKVADETLPALGAALVAAGADPEGLTLATAPKEIEEIGELNNALYKRTITDQQCVRIVERSGETKVADFAFAYCNGLKNLVFDDTQKVTRIGQASFVQCGILKSVEMAADSKISRLDTQAFLNCINLESVVFSKVLDYMNYSFYGCSALKTVKFRSAFPFKYQDFSGCTALELWDFTEVDGNTLPTLTATASQLNTFSKLKALVPVGWMRSIKQATNWVNMKDRIVCSLEQGNDVLVEACHDLDGESTHMTLYVNGEPYMSLDAVGYGVGISDVRCIGIKYDDGYTGGVVSMYSDGLDDWEGAFIDNELDVLLPSYNPELCIHLELREPARKE